MSDATGQFGCDGCGKQYRWKAELAGKKVKCKCGQVMVVPDDLVDDDAMAMFELADGPSAAPAEPSTPDSASIAPVDVPGGDMDEYELSEDPAAPPPPPLQPSGPCPECGALLSDGVVLCVGCGFNRATGQKLGAASVAKEISSKGDGGGKFGGFLANMKGGASTSKEHISMGDAGDDKLWHLKQVVIPAALVVIGLILQALVARLGHDDPLTPPPGIGAVVIGTLIMGIIATVLLTGAAFVTAMIMEMSFGSLPIAILKFASVTIAPTAIAGLVGYFAGDWGIFVGFPIEIGLYFFLLYWLFDLDFMEIFVLVGINWVIQNFIMTMILAMFMGAMG